MRGLEERVLVLMPTARDGGRAARLLTEAGLGCEVCPHVDALCEEMRRGVGAVLTTEEAIATDAAGGLANTLAAQPPWSDYPLVVLARETRDGHSLQESMNVLLVERPVRVRSLLSVVRAALRSRRRQYEVRDHLVDRERAIHDRARLAAIVESTDDAVVSKTLDGVIQSWNAGAERLFGYAEREAVGRPVTILIPPERLDEEREIIDRLRRGERIEHFETVRVTKGGQRIDISLTVSPVRDARGMVVGASKIARDITSRRRAEDELRRLAEKLGLALDAGALGTWEWDAKTDAMVLSPRTGEIYGVEPGVPHSRDALRDLIHPDHRTRAREAASRAEAARTDYDIEYPLVNGRWVSARGRGVVGADGTSVGMIGVVQDITARRKQDESLRRSEGLLRLATDAAELGVWVWDVAADRVTWENDRPYEILGLAPSSGPVTAARFRDEFVHPDDAATFDRVVADAARTGERFHFQGRLRRADGEVRWVEFAGLPLRTGDGSPLRMHGTAADITVRKRAEEELRDTDRKKDDFIALLAHELRNPLAPIRNGLQVLRRGDGRSMSKIVDIMDRQLTHMVRMIDDLLDVSRIGRNKMELRRERVALADVIDTAVEAAQPALDEAGHRLAVSLPPEAIDLDADLTRLAQVFSNLLTNSAKYTPRNGNVWLTAMPGEGVVTVVVRDTGIGIPASALPTIFDMFSQVDRSVEKTTGGLGIGLALVKGLTEMHGGSVTAASDGAGSTFSVTLPVLADRSLAPAAPARRETRPRPGQRILVVDDNRDGAESLSMMLELLGNEVRTAHDGVDGVAQAESFRPHVILMDVGMPRLNGYDATRQIRNTAWGKDVTILALTGWGQEGDREQSRQAGCDGHLVKPVSLPDLEPALTGRGH